MDLYLCLGGVLGKEKQGGFWCYMLAVWETGGLERELGSLLWLFDDY